MVYVDSTPNQPVAYRIYENSSLGMTCPKCSKELLIQDGLTPQEAHHVLHEDLYEYVRFWPVRGDADTNTFHVVRVLTDYEGIDKTPDGYALVVAEETVLVLADPLWTIQVCPTPARSELIKIHDPISPTDAMYTLYYQDHTVTRGDRGEISLVMNKNGHTYGITEITPVMDEYDEYDEDDQEIHCALCNVLILGKRSVAYSEQEDK